MIELELDADGYPTDASLEAIRNYSHEQSPHELFQAIGKIWQFSNGYFWTADTTKEYFDHVKVRHYHLATAGWSGNESIISAIESNYALHSTTWFMSKRGGLHVFEVPL